MWRKIHIEAIDTISSESVSLCLVGEVINYSILPVLGIMEQNAGRKLKQMEMLLFHSSAIVLHYVLGYDVTYTVPLSTQLHCIRGCWVFSDCDLPLQQTDTHLRCWGEGEPRGSRRCLVN